ncbi:hypothetical protein B0H16DRAFT_1536942 [Mycena metata]|uniref:F-box domain-containing protein n=1 Tax=Mycena metata TaxID=1033252 RepID=A0AAD7NFC7_9AGAR|nr:hypothetical protein B0H16DRAFT_1536942 [Mycena metata]
MDISLPAELQRDIFELAIPGRADEKFLSLIEAKPPGFFATAVISLLIDPLLSDEQTAGILTACRGVESLALWGTTSWGHIPDFPYLPLMFSADRLKRIVDTLKHLHRLTHLALHFTLHPSIASAVSTNCPGLQVLVIIFDWSSSIPAWADKRYSFDDRIVVVQRVPSSSSEDWEAAHFGLSNVWTRAESAVAERRRAAGG